jgi:outer membrane lipoprotein SlyB
MKKMRLISAALLVVALSLLVAAPAAASCAPPTTVAENANRATAVVYGTVTDAGGGAVTLRVDRVLKGQVGATIRAFVGPGRGGGGGTPVATSIDYSAAAGSDHVLYLMRVADGQLEANACNGSHAGPPDPAELAFFGNSTSPSAPSVTPGPAVGEALPGVQIASIWPAAAIVLLGGATLIALRRRRA